jgi:hypothetical protein
VEVIRIEGVAFKVGAAREFAERVLIYDLINDPQPVGYWGALEGVAFTIQRCICDEGAFGDVTLNEQEKVAVLAVLDEWLQSRDAPDAAGTLYRALARILLEVAQEPPRSDPLVAARIFPCNQYGQFERIRETALRQVFRCG